MRRLHILITDSDQVKLVAAAGRAGLTVSQWVRKLCGLDEAKPQGRQARTVEPGKKVRVRASKTR